MTFVYAIIFIVIIEAQQLVAGFIWFIQAVFVTVCQFIEKKHV